MDFSFVFVLFFMLVQIILIISWKTSMILNLLFGLFGLVLMGLSLSGYVSMSLPFHPWFEVFFGLLSAVTILVPAVGGRS